MIKYTRKVFSSLVEPSLIQALLDTINLETTIKENCAIIPNYVGKNVFTLYVENIDLKIIIDVLNNFGITRDDYMIYQNTTDPCKNTISILLADEKSYKRKRIRSPSST